MRRHLVFCLALFIIVILPNQVSAQFENLQVGLDNAPKIQLDPPFPQPYEEVSASIMSGGDNTYGAEITWLLNGVEINSTKNKREVTITVGAPGEVDTIMAVLNKPGGITSSITKKITPLYLDLIIEPQTHVPEFYLGRAMPSVGSTVNVTALLSAKNILSPDLIYTWRIGRTVIGGGALRGQNKVSFEVPWGNFQVLSLEVSDLKGNLIASRSTFLPSVSPKIVFYEANILYGLNQTAVKKSLSLIGHTTVVRAEPYYLDSRVYNEPDILEWKIDNKTYQDVGQNPYEVILQKTGFLGRTSLNVRVTDTTQFLQGAEKTIELNI